jgi:signal transduction histidine kinase
MQILKKISIKNKLIIIQVLTALIALLICCLIFVVNDIKIFKESSINNKYSIAEILGINSIAPLVFKDQDALDKILKSLRSNPSILNAEITDKAGQKFAVYNKDGEKEFRFSESEIEPALFLGHKYIVSYHIFQGTEFLGTVWMRAELTALQSIISNYAKVAIFVLIVAFLTTLIISIFLQRIITNPLFAFVNKTKQVSENQDYSLRISYESEDEIGVLALEFNRMLDQIQKMESDLKENNQELEKRVKARTMELVTANNELMIKSDELVRSNLELEQFAYIASHDLQEPLRTISNFVGLFQKQFRDSADESSVQYLNYILGATERMQTLIIDLLTYSRIGHYKNTYEIDCNKVVKEVLKDFDAVISESKAVIKVTDLPVIEGHYSEIKSLFQNLLSNAIKFRDKNSVPEIEIRAEERENDWLFSVEDNGIGISEAYHDKLFKIFQRLHPQNEYSGTGIGLAQCKKIVELLGGKIWVKSMPGKGSTFYFNIPNRRKDGIS